MGKCDRQDSHPNPDPKIRTGVSAAFPPHPTPVVRKARRLVNNILVAFNQQKDFKYRGVLLKKVLLKALMLFWVVRF